MYADGYKIAKIPKKTHGKFRTICMPNPDLKKRQKQLNKTLTRDIVIKIRSMGLEDDIHGFLPNRSAVTGASRHIGMATTMSFDLEDFFDHVTQSMVRKAGCHHDGVMFNDEGIAAQGFPTSPVLATWASLEMMKHLKSVIHQVGAGSVITMYADDITVSSTRDLTQKEILSFQLVVADIVKTYGHTLNASKTRVRYSKFGWRPIYGVNVGDTTARATRKTMRKLRAATHQYNIASRDGLKEWSRLKLPKTA